MKKVYLMAKLIFFLFLINHPSVAQTTHTWINGDGNWSDTTHWNTATIPSVFDDVIIPVDPINPIYTVTLDTLATVANIFIGGTSGTQKLMIFNENIFTVNDSINIYETGEVILDNGSVINNGTFSNQGTLTLTNSTIDGTGSILNAGFASYHDSCFIHNFSNANFNTGIITLSNSYLMIEQEGFDPTFTTSGEFDIGIGSTLNINGGTFTYNSGIMNLNGMFSANSSSTINIKRSFTNSGSISINNSILSLDSTLQNDNVIKLINSTIEGTGSLLNEDTISAKGSTFDLMFTNSNYMIFEGINTINNELNSGINSTIQLFSENNLASHVKVACGFTNHGNIEFIGNSDYFRGTLEIIDKTPLINNPEGNILVSSTGSTMFKDRILAKLINQGELTLNNSLEINKDSVDHINSGTITVFAGELSIQQTWNNTEFFNTGEINVYVNSTFDLKRVKFYHNSGILNLFGTLSISANASVFIIPTFTNLGTINLMSSALNASSNITNKGEITLTDSKLTGLDSIKNEWNLKVINSRVDLTLNNFGFVFFIGNDTINNKIINQENSLIKLSSLYNSNCNLNVNNDIENLGTIEFEALYFNVFGILTVSNGKLINKFPGVISSKSSPQYANRILAVLDNNGKLTVEDSLVINKTLAHHINSSKIDLQSGGVIKFIGESFINESSGTLSGKGTLSVGDVSFINYGKIRPGIEPSTTAALNIHGGLHLENSSEIEIKLGRSTSGRINDRLNITDSAALSGKLIINLINIPAVGDTFEVMTFSGYTAQFDSISGLTDTTSGLTLVPKYTQNSLILICTYSNNLPPNAVDDSLVVKIDSTSILDVLANDSDPNGDPLSIVSISGPSNGTASIMPGDTLISYTPQAGYTDLDSLDYVITDGYFYDTAKVSINVSLLYITKINSLNLPITDFQTTSSNIHINLTGNKSQYDLVKVEVLIDTIFHSATGDLQFILKHDGFIDTLINQVGAYGDNFINTKLSDESLISISEAIPPFTGIYKPYNPLTVFNHLDPNDDWTLEIYDGKVGNSGVLTSWGLILYYKNVTLIDPYISKVPNNYNLGYNYPNPFNPSTTIQYSIKEKTLVELVLYDILGRQVDVLVKEEQDAGYYRIMFNAGNLPSGVYFYQLIAGDPSSGSGQSFIETKKMMLMK